MNEANRSGNFIPAPDLDGWIRYLIACRALGVAARQAAWPHPAHAATWLHRGRPERKATR